MTLVVSCDTGVTRHLHCRGTGENPLKKLKDARERDHSKGIDASESHGGLRFFAKSSYSELELRDGSLGLGQLFSKRRPLPAVSQAHSLLFPAPSHNTQVVISSAQCAISAFLISHDTFRCRGTALSCDTGSVTRHHYQGITLALLSPLLTFLALPHTLL